MEDKSLLKYSIENGFIPIITGIFISTLILNYQSYGIIYGYFEHDNVNYNITIERDIFKNTSCLFCNNYKCVELDIINQNSTQIFGVSMNMSWNNFYNILEIDRSNEKHFIELSSGLICVFLLLLCLKIINRFVK